MAEPAAARLPRHVDRYVAVGLTHNPFAAPGHDDRLGPAFADRGLPNPPQPGAGTLVQVIGEAGAGKTSQLHHWQRTAAGPHHWVPRAPYRSRLTTAPEPIGGIAYGDEIDRMPAPIRFRWFRRAARLGATLVVGTHVDLTRTAERAGLGVVTHHLAPADHDLLFRMIDRRLDTARCGPETLNFCTPELVDHVWRTSSGNLREADVLCHRLLAEHVASVQ